MQENWESLAQAIVRAAAEEYRAALRSMRLNPGKRRPRATARKIERFFRSGWFEILTGVNGEYLIQKLKEEEIS